MDNSSAFLFLLLEVKYAEVRDDKMELFPRTAKTRVEGNNTSRISLLQTFAFAN